jgi:subtilisin family serine protease
MHSRARRFLIGIVAAVLSVTQAALPVEISAYAAQPIPEAMPVADSGSVSAGEAYNISEQAARGFVMRECAEPSDEGLGYIVQLESDAPQHLEHTLEQQSELPESPIDEVSEERRIYHIDSSEELGDMLDAGTLDARYIQAIEPDRPLILDESVPLSPLVPDDPLYNLSQKSYAQLMNLPEVWALGRRGDRSVSVGVIDSGVRLDHIDFNSKHILSLPEHNYIKEHEDVDEGDPDYGDESNWTPDNDSHGTFVAGIIAAGLNNGLCIAGAQPDVTIVPYKVFDKDAGGSLSDLLAALGDAIDEGMDVVNMSLGLEEGDISSSTSTILKTLCQEAAKSGVLVIAAAGNGGDDTLHYPASYPEVVGVGSVNKDGIHSTWSQTGENVYVCAPGEQVASLRATSNDDTYISSGTSFASPYVAAAAALAKSLRPELTQDEFMRVLRESSEDRGLPGKDRLYGYGVVDFAGIYYALSCRLSAETLKMGITNRNDLRLDLSLDEEGIEAQDISWSVSNANATLTVADDARSAVVNAQHSGEATVTVVCNGAFGASTQSCRLRIEDVLLEEVVLTPARVALDLAGEKTAALACDLRPADAAIDSIEWRTDNRYVAALDISDDKLTATVNAGLKGSATVTVTVNDELVQTCKIVVSDSRLKDISLSSRSIALDLDAHPQEYVNLITVPSNANASGLIWSSSDPGIAEVIPTSDGRRAQVIGKEAGSALITATSPDGKLTARCDVQVTGPTLPETPDANAPAGALPETPNAKAPAGASYEGSVDDASVGAVTLKSARSYSYNAVKLAWTETSGASGYTIFYRPAKTGAWKQLYYPRSSGLSAVISRLKTGTDYQFKVRAKNDAGTAGKMSSVKTAKPVMKKATGLVVKKNGKRAVRLSWNKVDGANGYTIYEKTAKGSWKKVGDAKKRNYLKKGLDAKAKYEYRVRGWRTQDGKRIYGAYSSTVKR